MQNDLANYKILVEVLRGYLDTALTANIWFYALTGAVVANYLSKREKIRHLRLSLFVPFFLGLGQIVIFTTGILRASQLKPQVQRVAQGLEIVGAPPAEILILFLGVTSFVSLLICTGLVLLFFQRPKHTIDKRTTMINSIAEQPQRKSNKNSKLTDTTETCIGRLANWYSQNKLAANRQEAMDYLSLDGDEYVTVMQALQSQGIIGQDAPSEAVPFHEFTILPKAVEEWNTIENRDRVSSLISYFRSRPWVAKLIVPLLLLAALATGGNQVFVLLKNVGVVREQPTPTPLPTPSATPAPTPDTNLARYQGQPLDYWEVKLYDKDVKEATKASDALVHFRKLSIPILIKALSSDDERTVGIAVLTLEGIGPDAMEAVGELEHLKQRHKSLQPKIDAAVRKIRK